MNLSNELELMVEKRDFIQKTDEQILHLIEQRIEAAKVIGDIKKKNGKPIYAPDVEKAKIEKLSTLSNYPCLVEAIWPVIMCYTRTIE